MSSILWKFQSLLPLPSRFWLSLAVLFFGTGIVNAASATTSARLTRSQGSVIRLLDPALVQRDVFNGGGREQNESWPHDSEWILVFSPSPCPTCVQEDLQLISLAQWSQESSTNLFLGIMPCHATQSKATELFFPTKCSSSSDANSRKFLVASQTSNDSPLARPALKEIKAELDNQGIIELIAKTVGGLWQNRSFKRICDEVATYHLPDDPGLDVMVTRLNYDRSQVKIQRVAADESSFSSGPCTDVLQYPSTLTTQDDSTLCHSSTFKIHWLFSILANSLCSPDAKNVEDSCLRRRNLYRILDLMTIGKSSTSKEEIFSIKGFVSKFSKVCLDLGRESQGQTRPLPFIKKPKTDRRPGHIKTTAAAAAAVSPTIVTNSKTTRSVSSSEERMQDEEEDRETAKGLTTTPKVTLNTSWVSVAKDEEPIQGQDDFSLSTSTSPSSQLLNNMTTTMTTTTSTSSTTTDSTTIASPTKDPDMTTTTAGSSDKELEKDPLEMGMPETHHHHSSHPYTANDGHRHHHHGHEEEIRGTPAASTPAARQAKRNRVTEYMDEMDELMPSMPMIKYRVRQMFPMDVTLELEQPRNGGKRRLEQNKRRWTLKMEGACRKHMMQGKSFVKDHLRDVVYYNDLVKAAVASLNFANFDEGQSTLDFNHDPVALSVRRAKVLQDYLQLLLELLPTSRIEKSSQIGQYFSRLRDFVAMRSICVGSSLATKSPPHFSLPNFRAEEVRVQSEVGPFNQRMNGMEKSANSARNEQLLGAGWIGCRDGGYSCGLWQLFHVLTVEYAHRTQWGLIDKRMPNALDTIVDFVTLFYQSTSKSLFLRFVHLRPPSANSSPAKDAIWLWRTHNQMNFILHDFAKMKAMKSEWTTQPTLNLCNGRPFPEKSICSRCYSNSSGLDLASDLALSREVARSLSHYYEEEASPRGNRVRIGPPSSLAATSQGLDLVEMKGDGLSIRHGNPAHQDREFYDVKVVMRYLYAVYINSKILYI